jgi:hypothetical protein
MIIGYNENPGSQTGSANLVLGTHQTSCLAPTRRSRAGGIVAGYDDTISAPFTSISGGYGNIANREYASVGGGSDNTASGSAAAISGGSGGLASGTGASVAGGYLNTADQIYSSVLGGNDNTAGAPESSISGGPIGVATSSPGPPVRGFCKPSDGREPPTPSLPSTTQPLQAVANWRNLQRLHHYRGSGVMVRKSESAG